tara:strand:- start:24 stop:872 length:849 start_codon:yes stop_codon:yes gene_type:complete
MAKNVVYCLCCYTNKTLQQKFIDIIISDYKNVFNKLNLDVDFKIITTIPDIITNSFTDIKDFYNKKSLIEKEKWKSRHSAELFTLSTNCDNQLEHDFPRNEHSLKVWNTKFYIIEDFFKSNYDAMIYLDCDLSKLRPTKFYKYKFTFNEDILGFTPHWDKKGKRNHTTITKKYFPNMKTTHFIKGGSFYINKKKSFNIENIVTIDNVVKLWKKDSWFLREEIALTYLFHKYELIDKTKAFPLYYKHLGSRYDKIQAINKLSTYKLEHEDYDKINIWDWYYEN